MSILVNVVGQKMYVSSTMSCIVDGSRNFVKFRFNFSEDWDGLQVKAQFKQNGTVYHRILDDENSVFLPSEIVAGTCTLMLTGSSNTFVFGTSNYLTLKIEKNIYQPSTGSDDSSGTIGSGSQGTLDSAPVTNLITVTISETLDDSAYFLVTQPVETDDESTTEEARRIPLSVLVDYLKYEPIDITSITNSVRSAEIGSTVNSVKVSWSLNRSPASQTVTVKVGDTVVQTVDVATTDRAAILTDLNLTEKTIFTVDVADERGATNSEDTGLYFYNGVYYGVLEDGVTLDSAAILSLSRKLQSVKDLTFTVTADDTQRIAYALPTDGYGTPTFKDMETTFPADMYLAETIAFTNASGHTENYDIWLSTNVGLGTITVAVS